KSLGEQIILADKTVTSTVVRPAIVESAVRYPFSGWNEGFNTTAPLVYLVLKGHTQIPAGQDTVLDLVPVDFVAAGMLLATAAVPRLIDDKLPRWGAPRLEALAERAKDELTKISHFTGQVIDLIEMFKPFNYDFNIRFRCDNIRALWRQVTPADQERLWWGPE